MQLGGLYGAALYGTDVYAGHVDYCEIGHTIYAYSVGIISKTPLQITSIDFYPYAVGDTADLNWWDEANAVSDSKQMVGSVTITEGSTITDAGSGDVLTSTLYADGSVIRLFPKALGGGSGSALNHDYHLITTAGDDNVIVVNNTLTNEATKSQLIEAYPARPVANFKQSTATGTHKSQHIYFGEDGIWVPNLVLEGISGKSYLLIHHK